jgi:hypothetical protein
MLGSICGIALGRMSLAIPGLELNAGWERGGTAIERSP